MAESNQLAKKAVTTKDGVVTATVYDRVSPGRVATMLFKGASSAIYAGIEDTTPSVSASLKNHVVSEPQGE